MAVVRACCRHLALLCLLAALLPWLGLGPGPFGFGGVAWPRAGLLEGGELADWLAAPLRGIAALPWCEGLWVRDADGTPTHIHSLAVSLFWACLALGLLLLRFLVRSREPATAEPTGSTTREAVPAAPTPLTARAVPTAPARPTGLKRGIGTAKRARMHLEAVGFEAACPSLRCDCYLEKPSSLREASTLVVKFSGTYRHGSAGDPDAAYMRGMLKAAGEFWEPTHLVLDLSDLSYVWGEALDTVIDQAREEVPQVAIVLGELCRPALTSLLRQHETGDDGEPEPLRPDEGFVDNLDAAFLWVHRRR